VFIEHKLFELADQPPMLTSPLGLGMHFGVTPSAKRNKGRNVIQVLSSTATVVQIKISPLLAHGTLWVIGKESSPENVVQR